MTDSLEGLAAIVGPAQVLTEATDTAPYVRDWRGRYQGQARCVVRPGTAAEVSQVVRLCLARGWPMVPQGGNTSLCGAATPDASGGAVVISLARLNRIRAVDGANNTLTAEAGCLLASVQERAAAADRLFPLALASEGSCQVGGNLSTNAGGVHVLRYGNTRDLTLGLEVVLPSGELWDGLRGLRKDNTGYDLKHLFIGAEGTLGIITAAVFKLFPLPAARAVAWLAVPDPQAALDLLQRAQDRFQARLIAFELVSRPALALVLRHIPGMHDPLPGSASPWFVLLELNDGGEEGLLQDSLTAFMGERLEGGEVTDGVLAQSRDQVRQLWALRENISEAQKREGVSIKHDVAVPVARVPEFLSRAEPLLTAAFPGVRIVAFGHAGDGNLHYNLSQPERERNDAFIAATPSVNARVYDLVTELGGTISAEHGLGQLKRDMILRYKSPLEMDMMRAVKHLFDPRGLMNPGKIFA